MNATNESGCVSQRGPTYNHITIAACVFNSIFALPTVLANAMILAAFWKTPSLRQPSSILLCGLALTDLGTGILVQPFFTVMNIGQMTCNPHVYSVGWIMTHGVGMFLVVVSALTMTAISVEKYLALFFHMRYEVVVTFKRVLVAYVCCLVVPIPFLLHIWFVRDPIVEAVRMSIYGISAILCFVATPLAYVRICAVVRRHLSQIQHQANLTASFHGDRAPLDMFKYKKSVVTMSCMLALFVLSYLPFTVCSAVYKFVGDTDALMATFNVCTIIIFFNSLLNPILVCLRMRKIRDFVKQTLMKMTVFPNWRWGLLNKIECVSVSYDD